MSGAWARAADQFHKVAERLWQRGLIAGSGGNLSLRVPEMAVIMIKPSGIPNVDCGPDTLLGVAPGGRVLVGEGRPSRDVGFHLGIYAQRPDIGGVVHAHVPWSTALTLLGYDELPLLTPHALEKLRRVVVVPYAPSDSKELNRLVVDAFRDDDARAVLLGRHGLVTGGDSLAQAQSLAEMVEEAAKIALLVHLGGQGKAVAAEF